MKTAYQTGPGFFAAYTSEKNPDVPKGMIRFYLCRLEAYDGPIRPDSIDGETSFKILAAMADGKPEIARALLLLGDHVEANRAMLKEAAGDTP